MHDGRHLRPKPQWFANRTQPEHALSKSGSGRPGCRYGRRGLPMMAGIFNLNPDGLPRVRGRKTPAAFLTNKHGPAVGGGKNNGRNPWPKPRWFLQRARGRNWETRTGVGSAALSTDATSPNHHARENLSSFQKSEAPGEGGVRCKTKHYRQTPRPACARGRR